MKDVLLILLGWLLGLLSPVIAEKISRSHRRTDLTASVVAELSELQYTMVAVAFKLRSRLATATDQFVDWVLPIVRGYQGPGKMPALADNLATARQFPEAQRRHADLAGMRTNTAVALKQYPLPFLSMQGSELSICSLDFQRRVYRTKGQLELFNQQVTFLQNQYDKTFDSGISVQNRENVDRNLEDGYARLAESAEQIARAVGEILERYSGSKSV